jgi:hypothetical protein
MIWHPMLLSVLIADFLGAALVFAAAVTALRITLNWSAGAADRRQLALEVKSESAVIQVRWALALFLFSFILWLIAISNIFASLIPGAMCGTGVMQAMGRDADSALVFRCLLLGALLFWNELENLNRSRPDHPLTLFNARILLAVIPAIFLTLFYTVRAVSHVDLQQPVNCCALVYDQFRTLSAARHTIGVADRYWVTAYLGLSALLLFCAARLRFSGSPRAGFGLVLTTLMWLALAAVSLVNILSAYHYGVLQHHCPWCLFLPEHRLVGYPLYATLAVVLFETATAYLLPKASKNHPALDPAVCRRSRKAGTRIFLAGIIFLTLTLLPPIVWHLRFGTWMG